MQPQILYLKLPKKIGDKTLKNDPNGYLNTDFTLAELKIVLHNMENNKATGWDDIPNEALKNASIPFQTELLELINKVKHEKTLPTGWNSGTMILIYKQKGAIEDLVNYRPLTINISFYSAYTKLTNLRLTAVAEAHTLLGEIQGGFRKNRGSSDNHFILNTILNKAASKKKKVFLTFVDLNKAYDSVNRDILWKKMEKLGFSKDFIDSIRLLYHNDNINLTNMGLKTNKMYIRKGVRQGCSLSPMLFAIYISDLGESLLSQNSGFLIGHVNINSLFFADDIILLTKSRILMDKLLALLVREGHRIDMTISNKKSQVISHDNEPHIILQDEEDNNILLKAVKCYKYLGLEVYKTVFKTATEKQNLCITKAKKYKSMCMLVSKTSVDKTIVASTVWTCVAIPSILYATEFVAFSDTTIKQMNTIQSSLAKSVLGLPQNAPNFVAQTELGWPHFGATLWTHQLNAFDKLIHKPKGSWASLALMDHLSNTWRSHYIDYITKIKNDTQLYVAGNKKLVELYMQNYYNLQISNKILKMNLPYYKDNIFFKKSNYISEMITLA